MEIIITYKELLLFIALITILIISFIIIVTKKEIKYKKIKKSIKNAKIAEKSYTEKPILTMQERTYYKALRTALFHYDVEIHYKIRLADIFRIKNIDKNYKKNLSVITASYTDFIITEAETTRPLIAIELDDPYQNSPDRLEKDNFKNAIYHSSDIKLIKTKIKAEYDFSIIRQLLKPYLKTSYVTDRSAAHSKAEEPKQTATDYAEWSRL